MGSGSMSKTPIIGVVARSMAGAQPYAEIVQRHGGVPWLILADDHLSVEEYGGRMSGLLVSSGGDMHPSLHGERAGSKEVAGFSMDRDSAEMLLIEAALENDIPVLCVSHGMQALNVVLGGTLIETTSGHGPPLHDGEEVSAYHRIYISPGSKLAAIVGSGGIVRVNSRHRQGIKESQKSRLLLASAYSIDDGVIEALESPDHDWVIGVQFQPERSKEVPPHFDRLFLGLVERAR